MINYLDPNFSDLPGRRPVRGNYMRGKEVCDHTDISIITPYYNADESFAETFVSLQAQSLQNWEWIIVDDESPDQESVKRLKILVKQDDRIKIIRRVNGGTAAARNTGFNNSKGRYICLLDHDDMLEPTYLEKCVWFLDSNSEFSFCNSYSVVFDQQEFLWTTGYERGREYLQANSSPPISVIRRTSYEECGGFDESIRVLYEDWDFWLAMAKVGHWGFTIPEYLQWYRKLGSGRYEQILESGYDNNDFARTMQEKYPDLEQSFPEPSRRTIEPYEAIDENTLVCNPLEKNKLGRRIMFIVPWMVTGGADRVNLDLVEGLVSKGHEITICATLKADHQWEHQFSQFTPDIFILPNILHAADYPKFLKYIIESRGIDTVVVTGSTFGYQILPFLRSVSPGVAFIDMCHVEELHWLNGGHPRFGVGYQDVLDLNIVTTNHLSEWMQRRGADSERIRVMYTGVRSVPMGESTSIRKSVRTELNVSDEIPVIIFAGRLCEQKRPGMLIEILKSVHDDGLLFHALIIGDGEQKELLEELLNQYHLNANIKMLGSVSHERWLNLLVASDLFLMPSQYEGISIALLEAIAAGVVPIVSKVGGQEEIVGDNIGKLIPHGDNELKEYLNTIRHFLANPKELQRMSEQCLDVASSKLSWENMISNFMTHIDEAHALRENYPRHSISLSFGKELVSQAIEYKRINDEMEWNWLSNVNPSPHSAISLFVIFFSKTRVGRIMIKSHFFRNLGKKLLGRKAT